MQLRLLNCNIPGKNRYFILPAGRCVDFACKCADRVFGCTPAAGFFPVKQVKDNSHYIAYLLKITVFPGFLTILREIIFKYMEYSKLIAVTGFSGLFELISSKKDGAIVESLADRKRNFVSNRVHQFSHLESIEVYTVKDNVNLTEVFKAMEGNSTELPAQDNAAVKKYFQQVYPDMDFDRVYISDMKKMVKWYAELKKNNVEIKLSEAEAEEETEAETEPEVKAEAAEEPKKTKKAKDSK
jgi:Domain of unknown function (DUF5606)